MGEWSGGYVGVVRWIRGWVCVPTLAGAIRQSPVMATL